MIDIFDYNNIDKSKIIYETEYWYSIFDSFPVSEGHILIISKENTSNYFSLNYNTQEELPYIINLCKHHLDCKYNPNGYNIGINCGEAAGQSVNHCHVHLIPRYLGDCENPKGGVRGVIPEKQKY